MAGAGGIAAVAAAAHCGFSASMDKYRQEERCGCSHGLRGQRNPDLIIVDAIEAGLFGEVPDDILAQMQQVRENGGFPVTKQ